MLFDLGPAQFYLFVMRFFGGGEGMLYIETLFSSLLERGFWLMSSCRQPALCSGPVTGTKF